MWVELPGVSISWAVPPTSLPGLSRWLKRLLLVLVASAAVKVGLSTSILDALVGV